VLELICREIKKGGVPGADALQSGQFSERGALEAICAWLVINTMASERIQQQQLYMQNAGALASNPPFLTLTCTQILFFYLDDCAHLI
jgi:hypothetical protein